jgi:ATP-binding cassette subfamily B protein
VGERLEQRADRGCGMSGLTARIRALWAAYKRVADALDGPARRMTLLGVGAMTSSAIAAIAAAAMLAFAVASPEADSATLALIAAVALGVMAQALDVVKWRCHAEAELRLEQSLTLSVFAEALDARSSSGLGAEMQALGNALAGCRMLFQHLVFTAPAVVIASAAAAFLVLSLGHLALALAMLAYAPIYLAAACWGAGRMARAAAAGTLARVETARRFADALANSEVVRAFHAEAFVANGLGRSLVRATKWASLLVRVRTGAAALNVAVYGAALAGVLWLAWTTIGGEAERAALVVFTSLTMASLVRPLEMAAQAFRDLILALALVDPLLKPRALEKRPAATDISAASVRLEKISVSYHTGCPVLREASWVCARGAKVGLRGESGAGKSTVVRLLTGQIRPVSGEVSVTGASPDHAPVMAIALQETFLLDATIRANIAFGREASEEEIEQAVAIVGLSPLVAKLPKGLETRVGERGARLSGGERQRVALARAILKPAGLYVFDEATSALDPEAERTTMRRIVESRRCATILIVAHREAAFCAVDVVVDLKNGELVAAGHPA